MKKFNLHGVIIAMAIIFSLASCNKNQDKTIPSTVVPNKVTDEMISENGANPDEASITQNISATANEDRNFGSNNSHHYLYTESNESSSNKILVYQIKRNADDGNSVRASPFVREIAHRAEHQSLLLHLLVHFIDLLLQYASFNLQREFGDAHCEHFCARFFPRFG